jgi:predicted RNase H-like HicB family nuclease
MSVTLEHYNQVSNAYYPGGEAVPEWTQDGAFNIPERYLNLALARRTLRQIEDHTWIAEIPGFEGVWANGASAEDAGGTLYDVLSGWLALKMEDGDDDIPVLGNINLNP